MTEQQAREYLGVRPHDRYEAVRPLIESSISRMQDVVGSVSAGEKREQHIRNLQKMQEAANVLKAAAEGEAVDEAAPSPSREKKSQSRMLMAAIALLFIACAVVWWIVFQNSQKNERLAATQRQQEVRAQVEEAILERKWSEADKLLISYSEAGAPVHLSQELMAQVVEGKMAAKRQRLAYLAGVVRAKSDAGQWAEAEESLAEISLLDSEYEDRDELRELITSGRNAQQVNDLKAQIRKALEEDNLNQALLGLNELGLIPGAEDARSEMSQLLKEAEKKEERDRQEARRLTELARSLDEGRFSAVALDYLRSALALDPSNPEARSLFEKMSSYGRTIRVPEDFASLDEAMQNARENDTLTLGAGTFQGSLVLLPGMNVIGAGFDETIITCAADQGSAVVFAGKDEQAASISNLRLKHSGAVSGEERFALITVTGGLLKIAKVKALGASGHGLYLASGATADVISSRFSGSGWDGVAVSGPDSAVKIRDCAVSDNLNSGIAAWGGGQVDISDSHIEANVHSGIAISGASESVVRDVRLWENRDSGLWVGAGAMVTGSEITAEKNLNGGIVVMPQAKVGLRDCMARGNGFGGYIFARGAESLADENNRGSKNGNSGQDLRQINVEFVAAVVEEP